MPYSTSTALNSVAVGGRKTLRERILLLPEDYLGSVQKITRNLWVYDSGAIVPRVVTYVPGLFRMFDEILVHAANNKQCDPSMDCLRIQVDVDRCIISVYYNGDEGIPVDINKKEGLCAPEMIFDHLTNGDQGEEISGVKLTNIFSTEFEIESTNKNTERKYRQVFTENMGKRSEPQVTVFLQGVSWTRITFRPDMSRFNMSCLDDDFISLASKRAADMAGILGPSVQVVFNGHPIQRFTGFLNYITCYLFTASNERPIELPSVSMRVNDRLEVGVTLSEGRFKQVSFINNYATIEGGSHVEHVANQIAAGVVRLCMNDFTVEEDEVKRHLWVFVNATLEKPSFRSPTKEALTTPLPQDFQLSDEFLHKVVSFIYSKISPWDKRVLTKKAMKKRKFTEWP